MSELPDGLFGFGPYFHLRDGFRFSRGGDQVLIQHGAVNLIVPVTEWASAVAATSLRGDTGEAWREAVEYLNAEASSPPPKKENKLAAPQPPSVESHEG